jgi:hypothetical protein
MCQPISEGQMSIDQMTQKYEKFCQTAYRFSVRENATKEKSLQAK